MVFAAVLYCVKEAAFDKAFSVNYLSQTKLQ